MWMKIYKLHTVIQYNLVLSSKLMNTFTISIVLTLTLFELNTPEAEQRLIKYEILTKATSTQHTTYRFDNIYPV